MFFFLREVIGKGRGSIVNTEGEKVDFYRSRVLLGTVANIATEDLEPMCVLHFCSAIVACS